MEDQILRFALQNAIKFGGKANVGAVIGKLFSEHPELKKQAKETNNKVLEVVKKVNSMSLKEQEAKLKELAPQALEEKKVEKKKKELPPLKNAIIGKVVTRIPPEPSKYAHIGHALSFLINYLYAQKYKGRCVLRFEDTNPVKAEKEYYKSMEEDIKWMKIKWNKKVIVSNHMQKFYTLAQKLIKASQAYVCFCSKEKMENYRRKAMICDCRAQPAKKNMEEWMKMLNKKYKEGKCTLRLKGQMNDANAVMRDPVIFRICTSPHPIQGRKWSVWPMYDFENAIEEHICGITHVMRSDEFGRMRIELQSYIKKLLGLKNQEVLQYSRFNVIGAVTQGREIRKLIEEKKVIGWDDPSLVTIKALKRRGIQPEALHELAVEAGLSAAQTNIDWTVISAINRKILDPKVNRYFFVENPKKIRIKDCPVLNVKIDLHPDFPKRGKRSFKTSNELYIFDEIKKGKTYRLMHLLNFKDGKFLSTEYDPKLKAKIIHWLPADPKQVVNVEILMPNSKVKKGIAEKTILKVKEGEVVQAERQFFMRCDKKKKNKVYFWFTHR